MNVAEIRQVDEGLSTTAIDPSFDDTETRSLLVGKVIGNMVFVSRYNWSLGWFSVSDGARLKKEKLFGILK